MTIEFDTTESAAVCDVLQVRLGNLSSEIRHTDSPRLRKELRAEREVLRGVLAKLQPLAA